MKTYFWALLGFLLAATSAIAQPPAPAEAEVEPKGYTDKPSGITFPTEIGDFKLQEAKDFGDPKLGIGIRYRLSNVMLLDVIIYNLGFEKIPSDLDGPELKQQVDHAVENIKMYAEKGFYGDLQLQEAKVVPLRTGEKAPKAHVVDCSFVLSKVPRSSRLYLLAHHNQFVKIRATWDPANKDTCEKELEVLLNWLANQIAPQP